MLKQFDAQGKRMDKLSGGTPTKLSQREVARQAGISRDQQVQAVRVANVPRGAALIDDDEWKRWSDREIARRCGVGADMVGGCAF